MASLPPQNLRRRSHSASPSSPSAHSPDKSWRAATKRAYPHNAFSAKDASSPQKWDVDVWRRGKRRRQETLVRIVRPASVISCSCALPQKTPPFVLGDRSKAAPPSARSFATTSSEFHFFPKRNRDNKGRTRRSSQSFDSPAMEVDDPGHSDLASLSHLRSAAFWELHRSIAENGEGLVRRMRDYEQSRSRPDVYLKAKEAQRRCRKRSSLAASSRRLDFSDPESDDDQEKEIEEDEVLIFAGELPRIPQPRNTGYKKRSLSLDVMDEDTSDREFTAFTRRGCSSPGVTCHSNSSIYHSDDDRFHSSGRTSPLTQSLSASPPHPFATSVVPEISDTHLDSENSSPASPPLSSLPPPTPLCSAQSQHNALPTSRSEKAIAALSLAMANGAGGIADYEALLAIQTSPDVDHCQVGEMWH
ncbi:hypothetical protein LshimejAT787_0305750 [Lyophyllum shimeji]|uniref:Uncharacterized protein n=1 Tax=Lyophyllum shimeji TaxID=47721 RepID=A0A9P3PJ46_LYOSH|nr:hypothetical protein LshimejAT787_0305750 [Lyophyllum shimeji]